jgi:hypothetical protein
MRQTCLAICYSAGACAAMVIPILGVYPFFFVPLTWWIVSACLMVAEGQRVNGFRATLAVVVPPVLVVSGFVALLVVGVTVSAQSARSAAQSAVAQAECAGVTAALVGKAQRSAWPAHAVEMVDESFTGWQLTSDTTATVPSDVTLGATDLEQIWALDREERTAARAAAASLPAGVVAHRLGDFVFTYHGIDPRSADPALWIVVMSPDPDVNAGRFILGRLFAGTGDGAVHQIDEGAFTVELAAQNDLRRTRGLAPLPPPWDVTHAQPARGP